MDARYTGHESHEELNHPIPYPAIGDSPDRYITRLNEIIESCRIIHALPYIIPPIYYLSIQYSSIYLSMVMEWLTEESSHCAPRFISVIKGNNHEWLKAIAPNKERENMNIE